MQLYVRTKSYWRFVFLANAVLALANAWMLFLPGWYWLNATAALMSALAVFRARRYV